MKSVCLGALRRLTERAHMGETGGFLAHCASRLNDRQATTMDGGR
ncbi:MAG: hypothetical protein ACW7DP_13155 [Paraglaciecola chathamensis]